MEQIKEDLQHVYNLSVESFNKKEYSAFFRNIRPGIEYLSQFLIYDFFGNEDEAEDLINVIRLFPKIERITHTLFHHIQLISNLQEEFSVSYSPKHTFVSIET